MTGMELGNILLYAGAGVMALAVVGFIVVWLSFRARKKRLDKELEREYGEKNRRGGN